MRIDKLQTIVTGVDPRDAQRASDLPQGEAHSIAGETRPDSLDISLTAKLSISSKDAVRADAAELLSAERLAELRGRIQSGFYDQPGPLETTAESLLTFYSQRG